MQEKHLFEYAVIRVVPRVEREEFMNVGIVLFCKKQKYLKVHYRLQPERLQAVHPGVDLDEIRAHLEAYRLIAEGSCPNSPIAQLDPPSRFRWLTATRSTIVQSSKVHPGLCADLPLSLERLFQQYVL